MSALRIWTPDQDADDQPAPAPAHRIYNPVRTLDEAHEVAQDVLDTATQPETLTELERIFYRTSASLRGTWKKLSQNRPQSAPNRAKTAQALNRWEAHTRPRHWPKDRHWPGLPIGLIFDATLTTWIESMDAAGLSPATIRSTWFHLRTIFNAARAVGIIDRTPRPHLPPAPARAAQIFSDADLARAYAALTSSPALQVAFVLAVNVGARPVDLFSLRWEDIQPAPDRISFRARKTSKLQSIPLAPVCRFHLDRLPRISAYVFPDHTAPDARDPERSRPARRRNQVTKQLLTAAGLTFQKPWQSARATCNERLEAHRPGAGQFVLGHALTLNSRSYRQPDAMIRDAIETLPQPAIFWRIN